ncbi:hypothetical protein BS47DRAFT_1287112 [Hydnum rufescens UP504]|uniref:non-specific serine/threonine protein kinase n=1 Tax=Hydnum rufescens UP504 TaxID=1448309 RepID=A0A9P6BAS0_9AGAM|nr:hypothetical protein BS47DRAFT_1287112 [Hydnum rufescens UP504]
MTLPRTSLIEEDLILSADEGFGYFPAESGGLLNGYYQIVRKLGWGRYSSVWLTRLSTPQLQYGSSVCVGRGMTAEATRGHREGLLRELMETIKKEAEGSYLPHFVEHFEERGPHGDHLCLVMHGLGIDVGTFRRAAPRKHLTLHMTKIVVAITLEALEQLHDLGIIHRSLANENQFHPIDIKPGNIFFSVSDDNEGIEKILNSDGIADGSEEVELNGQRYWTLASQSIPSGYRFDAPRSHTEILNVALGDFGHAQWVGRVPTTKDISPYALRAPEVILRAPFDAKVDVWSIGCLTFELLTGHWLFSPVGGSGWRREDDYLAKMMEITGDAFSPALLDRSEARNNYFDAAGNLLRIDALVPMSLENLIAAYKVFPEKDILPAAKFIRDCLRLDPDQRPLVVDLQVHDWMMNAWNCWVCYCAYHAIY